ncbi:MAG: FAD-dependent monooxygenase, partial [Polyangiaceae bacterium]
ASWRKDNIVLVGDAAHTAHFSIGSGTKLAMEDAIALAAACKRHKNSPEAAIEAYELERRPVVERIQKAAQDSLTWFENSKRYARLDPIPFAFSLAARSKKIGYANLKLRDPAFVDEVTREFASHCPGAEPTTPPMFTPFRLRGLTLVNRVVVSPMCMYSADDGTVNDFHLVHLGSRAMGGAGLVSTEMTDVSRDGRITPGCAGMYKPEHVVAWRRIVDFVHARSSAKISIQLAHAGRKGSTKVMWEGMDEPLDKDNWPLISASPIAYGPGNQVPRAMNGDDMKRVKAEFVRSVGMAEEAGFDMIEVHMAHGYLLASFLSPLTNVRTDAYGGSLENRMRYPLEVFTAMREAWPKSKPMSVRISATDWVPGGFVADDAVIVARALKERGCDIIDVSAGQTTPDAMPVYGRMFQTPFSDQVRNDADIPTMTVGNISSADQVNTILAARRADLCVLARPHLRNPNWTLFAAEEQGYFELPYPEMYSAVKPPRPFNERGSAIIGTRPTKR